jgi:hypothetical protein
VIRKEITRKIVTSKVYAFSLEIEEGKPITKELEPLTFAGRLTESVALRRVTKFYGKSNSIKIAKIETSEDTYKISVEDFIRNATKVEPEKV